MECRNYHYCSSEEFVRIDVTFVVVKSPVHFDNGQVQICPGHNNQRKETDERLHWFRGRDASTGKWDMRWSDLYPFKPLIHELSNYAILYPLLALSHRDFGTSFYVQKYSPRRKNGRPIFIAREEFSPFISYGNKNTWTGLWGNTTTAVFDKKSEDSLSPTFPRSATVKTSSVTVWVLQEVLCFAANTRYCEKISRRSPVNYSSETVGAFQNIQNKTIKYPLKLPTC